MIYLEVATGDAKLIQAVVKAVIKEARKANLQLSGDELAARLIKNYEGGERDFIRLTALVLGAERAPVDRQWPRAN